MAGNIKGITIEFRGDTTNLQKALRAVDSETSKVTKSIKDVDKALKFNPNNVELLKQKQGLLKEEIQQTTEKLHVLRKAQTEYNNQGVDKNSAEYQKLRREIIETESKLKTFTAQSRELNNVKLTALGKQLQEVGGKMQEVGESVKGVGQSITTHLTLPIAAAFAASSKAFIDWESAFTGVMKTVDETATTSYADIEEGIKKLATETASSKTEIAGVAEVAGQLGISADDVVEFTKVMVELGDTTSLSAEDAAVSLARIINITGDSADSIENLGSVIVALGNNFATNETEITEMANRLAASGKLAGLTTTEIFALSAAMSSVGIQAEAGGTAMTQTLTAIEREVANFTSGADSNLEKFAEIAGMTASDFASTWSNEPIVAVQEFISGLGSLDEQGESATLILDELGLSGIRQSNMLKSLALASDTMTSAVETANAAYGDNTALTDEASKRYGTMEAKISQAKERITEIAIAIGEKLMPYLQKGIDFVQNLIDKWNGLSDSQKTAVLAVLAVIAVLGPLISIIGTVIGVIGTLTTVAGTLGVTVGAVCAPILAVIAAIAALVAVGVALHRHWDEITAFMSGAWETIKTKTGEAVEWLKGKIQAGFDFIKQKIITPIIQAKDSVVAKFQEIKQGVVDKIESLKQSVKEKFDSIKEKITEPVRVAKEKIKGFIDDIKGFFNFKWEFPKLKLPHFRVSGSMNPLKWIDEGVPKITVDWYKRGGIFNSPSVIGVGEAGTEAVVPLDKFWNKLDGISGGNTININVSVNGTENPEVWAQRLVKQMKLEMRSV